MACAGRYELANNQMLTFVADQGRLVTLVDAFPDEELVPAADDRFSSVHRNVQVSFLKNSAGEVSGLVWKEDAIEKKRRASVHFSIS